MSRGLPARRALSSLVGMSMLVLIFGVGPVGSASEQPRASVEVIVRAENGPARAAHAVASVGGTVITPLPIVSGVSASVPADRLAALAAAPGVDGIAPNENVRFAHHGGSSSSHDESVYTKLTGAEALWSAGHDGDSVKVALIDTGVTEIADLAGRIAPVPDPTGGSGLVRCVNFSGEPTCDDSYGHGTFMAGLIAGTGASSAGKYKGMAPGTQIVSLKIAGRDGSADITKVLAAIQWVVSFKNIMNIRVLNLSLGTNSTVSSQFDPLNFAVQRAWRSGVVVVVSASNRGPDPGTISKPADDPLVITVGAIDDRATLHPRDDRLPNFSGRGPTAADGLAKPDFVAPGGRVISLRAPGSSIEQQFPGGGVDDVYRRGSGTSSSAAVTSGGVALMLDAKPTWTPDRVKFALMSTAYQVASNDPMAIGKGSMNVAFATWFAPDGLANQDVVVLSDGTGTLDGSRRDLIVTKPCAPGEKLLDPKCDRVHGERTAQGDRFERREYVSSDWTGSSWYESQWNGILDGSSWYGSSWYGSMDSTWYGSSWYGSSWYGAWD